MHKPISRRRFASLTAAAAGASCFDLHQMFAADALDRFGGWPIGIQSYSLRKFDLQQAVRHIQGLGLHYVEFYSKHVPLDLTDAQMSE